MPFGLVPIVPADAPVGPGSIRFRTDGESFLGDDGRRLSAADHAPAVKAALENAAARLPVRIDGNVHSSVVRLDPSHVRIALIDPGYLDPDDREAAIVLQRLDGIRCTDILSRETLPVRDGRIPVRVPMGVFRILDVEHR